MDRRKPTLTADAALAKIQRFCAYQERCHQEVRSKLLNIGVYGDTLESIMATLVEEDFLNEERFARSFARGKFRLKGWGRKRIVQELSQRHVSDYCIRKALSEIDEESYRRSLRLLLEKRTALLNIADPFVRRSRLAGYAIRLGYETELVRETLDSLKDNSPDQDPGPGESRQL
ncbi:MAG: hypothetical protein RLY31_2333 [Bacteroidota bacterium]|jgi:regulatory protein